MKRLPKKPHPASCDEVHVTPAKAGTSFKRQGNPPKRLSRSGSCLSLCKPGRVKNPDTSNEQAVELLRKEAYSELQRQIQHYNDQLVARMRFIESLPYEEQQSWLEAFVQHDHLRDQDEDIELIIGAMNDSASIKDYSPVIEWQQNQVYI
ncbi:hypothetical protein K493DRAFT_306973 [Basidiobolus meristosporus CBS 931.73]|uniref:Uncharacterized protein n=1 Tax=Basidiobolus meristosporus CBS 931.73 TaxID=1314790 RepID=A0A1Y1XMW6_9FUNG|nr:hypothetical protein K493DRAFT_306973 [Basidiobolus meristosporus CBS 931.73]|eukprot:ORX87015.1 hypothetical protein K493DRAFT_306973 [Basidiobolus meristosporus CBS 931.73]